MTVDLAESSVDITWKDKYGLVLDLSPLQGHWTEQQYLLLSNQTNRFVEFTDGEIEGLPMPTRTHQIILLLMYELLKAFLQPIGGKVLVAPLRMQVRPGKFREPDILLLLDAKDLRNQNAFWLGADLVVEIVSPDDPERDTKTKRLDYAEAGIPEYWIVNPLDETISVLVLNDESYSEFGVFRRGENATSRLLEGFTANVNDVFDAQ